MRQGHIIVAGVLLSASLAATLASCEVTEGSSPGPVYAPDCPCGGAWSGPSCGNPGCFNEYICEACQPSTNDPDAECCDGDNIFGETGTGGAYPRYCPGDPEWPEECGGWNPDGPLSGDGGAQICGDHTIVTCRGWIAGVYQHPNLVSWAFDFGTDETQFAECVEFQPCMPDLGYTQAELYEVCKQKCEEKVEAGEFPQGAAFPATYGAWNLHHTSCVFGDDGFDGMLPSGYDGITTDEYGLPGGFCTNIPLNSMLDIVPQIPTETCVPEETCFPQGGEESEICGDWSPETTGTQKPGPSIATSVNNTTKVITTSMPVGMLTDQILTQFLRVYICEAPSSGKYSIEHSNGLNWKFVSLYANGFFYESGFRTNDHLIEARAKTGPTTYGPWKNMESTTGLHAAWAALGSSIGGGQVKIKRGADTYTMNLATP